MSDRVDKSQLAFGIPRRIEDKGYRASANGRPCDVCGSIGTTVLAHIAVVGNSGTGIKPSDEQSLFLCFDCHADMDLCKGDRSLWIVRNYVFPMRRRMYEEWKHG